MSVGFELDPVTGEQEKPVAPPVGLLWAAAIALLAGAVLLAAGRGGERSEPFDDAVHPRASVWPLEGHVRVADAGERDVGVVAVRPGLAVGTARPLLRRGHG